MKKFKPTWLASAVAGFGVGGVIAGVSSAVIGVALIKDKWPGRGSIAVGMGIIMAGVTTHFAYQTFKNAEKVVTSK